jgi:hypothetical protein
MKKNLKFKCDKHGELEYVLIDGYSFGDTLLEGVMFEIRIFKGKMKAKVESGAEEYMENLNERKWIKAAEASAIEEEEFLCPKCGGHIYSVKNPLFEEGPSGPVVSVKMSSLADVFGFGEGGPDGKS